MVDSVYKSGSLGLAAEGLPDQYADGKAAKVWSKWYCVGGKQKRTEQFKNWIVKLLRDRKCKTVLDVACGTGVDSIYLLEEGFQVVSTDGSDQMLKYALEERWTRRKEEAFDKWVIKEANWLSLIDDLNDVPEIPKGGFDAVICLGNSFAHLPDCEGTKEKQRLALKNFKDLVKPGGILLIDHRNYDDVIANGSVQGSNVYYSSDHVVDIKSSILYVNGKPTMVILDYMMDVSNKEKEPSPKNITKDLTNCAHRFRLTYYPHLLEEFNQLLKTVFGENMKQDIFGDLHPAGELAHPVYYLHVIEKSV